MKKLLLTLSILTFSANIFYMQTNATSDISYEISIIKKSLKALLPNPKITASPKSFSTNDFSPEGTIHSIEINVDEKTKKVSILKIWDYATITKKEIDKHPGKYAKISVDITVKEIPQSQELIKKMLKNTEYKFNEKDLTITKIPKMLTISPKLHDVKIFTKKY